jgi:hypothetical protein
MATETIWRKTVLVGLDSCSVFMELSFSGSSGFIFD